LRFPAQLEQAATQGVPFIMQLAVTGGQAPYTWSVVKSGGKLPAGLTLNAGTGVISGTTTAAAGSYTFTLSVTDSLNQTASETVAMFVEAGHLAPLEVVFPSGFDGVPNTANWGMPYSAVIQATGGSAPYTFTLIPNPASTPPYDTPGLPTGLTLNSATGVISGTPETGEYAFTVKVTDSESPAQSATETIQFFVGVQG
jgi:large repetitive protein